SDQQVELFRELKEADRSRLLHVLHAPTREALKVLLSYPPTSAGGIMTTEFVGVPSTWTALDVRRHISEVGSAKETVYAIHVLGIVTVDDVLDALVREQTEDVQKFGGMEALDEPYMEMGFLAMVRKRAGWLCALFLGEMLTATAMGHFEHEIEKAVVLAVFLPLIISSGGNSGSQATSLIIRALALREVSLGDWWRIALRELPAGAAL